MAKTITLEEHFVTQDFLKASSKDHPNPLAQQKELVSQLLDLGADRIAAMHESAIDCQVISLAAVGIEALDPAEQTAVLRTVNDEAAAAVKQYPQRLAALANIGQKQPREAVKELERCINDLGFKGLIVNGTTVIDGEVKFLDAPEFFPLLEAATALKVPVYLHPAPPPPAVSEAYFSGLPGDLGQRLSTAGWGWHAETGLHVLRMIVSGVFDKLPTLQLIIGHMGEGLPYALARSSGILTASANNLKRSVAETLKQQVWITTSGYFTREPFDCCRAVVGLDRMMYSVDYPFSPNTRGEDFLASLELSPEELDAFRGGRAATLLKI
jgi:predicted TIM-barrel fold metal-dependent hydrolase